MHLLVSRGAIVTFTDPHVPSVDLESGELHSAPVDNSVENADCVVVVTDHVAFDYKKVVGRAKMVVDTRNALKGLKSENIVRL